MKPIVFALLFVLVAVPAVALTNGSADLAWDNTLDPTATVTIQYQSFSDITWKNVTSMTAPKLGTDGKMHSTVTFPVFPADNVTDHWICFQADDVLNGKTSVWSDTACNQVPVPALVVTPPPTPTPVPTPTPPPPTGLTVTQATPDVVVLTAKLPGDCKKVVMSTAGSTAAQWKRTYTCSH